MINSLSAAETSITVDWSSNSSPLRLQVCNTSGTLTTVDSDLRKSGTLNSGVATITGLTAGEYWVRILGYNNQFTWHYIRVQAASGSGPAITIAAGTSPVTEGAAAEFTVTADSAPSADLTVNLTVSDASGSDFVASGDKGSATVTITASIPPPPPYSVPTVNDSADETDGDGDGDGGARAPATRWAARVPPA